MESGDTLCGLQADGGDVNGLELGIPAWWPSPLCLPAAQRCTVPLLRVGWRRRPGAVSSLVTRKQKNVRTFVHKTNTVEGSWALPYTAAGMQIMAVLPSHHPIFRHYMGLEIGSVCNLTKYLCVTLTRAGMGGHHATHTRIVLTCNLCG